MGNSLRCCLACVLPCGALDLIRIVHLNGSVEEITGPMSAGEILKANPNHVLSKPCSQQPGAAAVVVRRRILILSPETELKRGSIYFLIPESSIMPPEITKKQRRSKKSSEASRSSNDHHHHHRSVTMSNINTAVNIAEAEGNNNPEEISSISSGSDCDDKRKSLLGSRKKDHNYKECRRVGVWRPYLDIIAEDC